MEINKEEVLLGDERGDTGDGDEEEDMLEEGEGEVEHEE